MGLRYWLLLLFFLLASYSCANAQKQIAEAKKYVGTVEYGNNQGFSNKYLESGLKKVGWKKGQPYCAFFVSFILNEINAKFPKTRTGMARSFINSKSILAKDVAKGYKNVPAGWLAIWRRGTQEKGHIGFVINWQKNRGKTIEANTSADKGSQFDGDGIWEKSREIISWGNFRIDYFTPVGVE